LDQLGAEAEATSVPTAITTNIISPTSASNGRARRADSDLLELINAAPLPLLRNSGRGKSSSSTAINSFVVPEVAGTTGSPYETP
jgi:hypothetical protein